MNLLSKLSLLAVLYFLCQIQWSIALHDKAIGISEAETEYAKMGVTIPPHRIVGLFYCAHILCPWRSDFTRHYLSAYCNYFSPQEGQKAKAWEYDTIHTPLAMKWLYIDHPKDECLREFADSVRLTYRAE